LPSFYTQTMKQISFTKLLSNAPDVLPFNYFTEDEVKEGHLPPRYSQVWNSAWTRGIHPMLEARIKLLKNLFFQYRVITSHFPGKGQGDALTIDLFCSGAVPGANHSCDAAEADMLAGKKTSSNSRLDVHYFILAQKARKRGILTYEPRLKHVLNIARKMTIRATEDRRQKLKQVPKVCMSRQRLEMLHDLSWKVEARYYPDADEDDHRSAFERYAAQGKFCSWDVDAMLDDIYWKKTISSWTGP